MYCERGWGLEFEEHLSKTDPFVTEVTWKLLPGLGRRQCAPTPHAGVCCCFAAVWYLLGEAVLELLLHGHFQCPQANLKKFLPFFPLCIISIPAAHPSPTSGDPFGQAILCVSSRYTTSWQQCESGTQSFPSFSFWRESAGGDFYLVRSRRRTWYDAWGKGCSKRWGYKESLKHCTSYSTCPSMLSKIWALAPLRIALHSCMGPFLPIPAMRWFPAQKGWCAPKAAGGGLASSGPMAPACGAGCSVQSNTQRREGAQPERLQAICVSNEQPINWLLKV